MDSFKLIALTGAARHGKDTAARYIDLHTGGLPRVALASYLKLQVMDIIETSSLQVLDQRKNDEDDNVRELLQTTGDITKRLNGNDFYSRILLDKLLTMYENKDTTALLTDLRYVAEYNELISTATRFFVGRGVTFELIVIKIVRDNVKIKQSGHSSESELDKIPYDYLIKNNGTIYDLEKRVRNVVDQCY